MEALVNNIIKATGWSIFHSLWQGAFLYGLLVLIFLMIPSLSARVKHNMAYGSLCLLFLSFITTFFSIFTWQPLSAVSSKLNLSNVLSGKVNYQTEHYFPLLVAIYVIGLLFQLYVLSKGYSKISRLKHSPRVAVPQEWQLVFQNSVKNLNLNKNIGFYLSHHVNVPLVIGFLKPVILFPVAFATKLDLQHVEAILIHELGHIRSNDYMLNMVKTVIETILFFNPFTWLFSKLIEREREHACDDLVVLHTNTPLTYAHALLQIELLKEKQTPVFSMAAGGNNQHLYQSIKRITAMKTTYNTGKQQLFAIGITIAIMISLAWANPLPTKPAVKSKITTVKNTVQVIAISPKIAAQQDTTKKKKSKTITKEATKNVLPVPPIQLAPPALPALPAEPAPPAQPIPPIPALKAEMRKQVEEMKLHFNSSEWKKYEAELQKMGAELQKSFNSPAFKKQMEEVKKHSEGIAKHFNSTEWKKQEAELQKIGIELQKKYNSPAFKKKIEEDAALSNTVEYKELELKFEKEVEALKNKKMKETKINK